MIKNLQAHHGKITCMENATDIGETGFKLLETSQKMVTGGADQLIKIWNIGANSGKLYDNIVIQLLLQVRNFDPVFALSLLLLSREVANTSFIVFGLT